MKRGFTLAEIMVVMAVLAVVGTIVLTIFIRTLRGVNKSQILSSIKQNGQSILETMDKTIRNSDNVVCPFFTSPTQLITDPSPTIALVKNGVYTRYRFIAPGSTAGCGSNNGCIIQDSPALPTPPPPLAPDVIKTFTNSLCIASAPFENPQVLTDTNTQIGVSLVSGSFTRNRQAGFTDVVTIKFDLKPGVDAPQAVAGQIDSAIFQTTIELR